MLQPVFRRLLSGGLSEFSLWLHPVSIDLSLEEGWLERDCLLASEKKRIYLIALDERAVKANKKAYYVYSAVDVERNELILIRVYTNRNYPVTRYFFKEVREKKPRFIVDKAPFAYRCTEKLGAGI